MASRVLGINALGRIGKLTLWYHLDRDAFDSFVMNAGRGIGKSLDAVAQYLKKDSTYGPLSRYLYGQKGELECRVVDEEKGLLRIAGKDVTILRSERNPKDIPWRDYGVDIVVDCSGKFKDPTTPADDAKKGSIRGHLLGGAKVVVNSSAFKIKDKSKSMPDDAVMLIYGINHEQFVPGTHTMVSAASCTTTGLAHMMRPLLNNELTKNMMTAGMGTVHAVTNTQSVLDSVPKEDEKDLRKKRSILNNIIITSTNAAKALEPVMPQMGSIGFMADSLRIPTNTASLIVLNATFQTEMDAGGRPKITQDVINKIYEEAAAGPAKNLLKVSYEQNVSSDMIGENAATVIEALETHTRTGLIPVKLPGTAETVEIPVTHAKIFGWYDNELGSYTHRMGELTAYIAEQF
ncbi:MAG: glyceraldehyde-3-phosphate dehydrogenase [Gaiellales bacterium]|nr:glyceraldehyde-3-phosphate dehydrogenase [Gaiellales bacterium]